jgi:hypothetical protein
MKGTLVILGATLIAGLIASTESPTPGNSVKPEAAPPAELQSSVDTSADDKSLLIDSASPTMTPTVVNDVREPIPPELVPFAG